MNEPVWITREDCLAFARVAYGEMQRRTLGSGGQKVERFTPAE